MLFDRSRRPTSALSATSLPAFAITCVPRRHDRRLRANGCQPAAKHRAHGPRRIVAPDTSASAKRFDVTTGSPTVS